MARLIPLVKKVDLTSGCMDARPVAVGSVWRRILARTLLKTFSDDMRTFFDPLKFAVLVAIPRGAELIAKTVCPLRSC